MSWPKLKKFRVWPRVPSNAAPHLWRSPVHRARGFAPPGAERASARITAHRSRVHYNEGIANCATGLIDSTDNDRLARVAAT